MNSRIEPMYKEYGQQILEEYRAKLGTKKFEETFSEVPEDRWHDFAIVLHNTEKSIPSMLTEMSMLNESTVYTDNVAAIPQLIIPALRKVWANLIAHNIVNVQPLSGPRGLIGFMNTSYGDDRAPTAKGDDAFSKFNPMYSSEMIDGEIKVAATNVDGVKQVWDDTHNSDERIFFQHPYVRPYGTQGYTFYRVEIHWYVDDGSGGTIEHYALDDGNGNFVYSGHVVGSIDYKSGIWTLDLSVTGVNETPKAGTTIWAKYWQDFEKADLHWKSASGYVGPRYGDRTLPTLIMDYVTKYVVAQKRALLMSISVDALDDFMNSRDGNINDIVNYYSTFMGRHIAKEIDEEIIKKLMTNAAHLATWNYGPTFGGANTLNELQSIRSMLTVIEAVSARITELTKLPGPFFIVASPTVASMLSQLGTHGDYKGAVMMGNTPTVNNDVAVHGLVYVSTLLNKYALYQDPYMDSDKILIGLRGNEYDVGFVYAPYIPIRSSGQEIVREAKVVTRFETRYATAMIRPEFYGVVQVNNLPTVTTTLP